MKLWKSSSFTKTFQANRNEAILEAITYLKEVHKNNPFTEIARLTWRCEDGAGFTITVTPKSGTVYCSHKWNAARS